MSDQRLHESLDNVLKLVANGNATTQEALDAADEAIRAYFDALDEAAVAAGGERTGRKRVRRMRRKVRKRVMGRRHNNGSKEV